jgi:hypothetical protein
LLRAQRPGILQLAADAIFTRQVFRRDAHMIVVEGIPQAIVDQAVNQLAVAQLGAGAAVGENVRRGSYSPGRRRSPRPLRRTGSPGSPGAAPSVRNRRRR